MPKHVPDCPEEKPIARRDPSRTFEIELITPMFGGGVEPRVNDPFFPIRGTAIRGQLQFWWRAIEGARYATVEELREASTRIWGSTKEASSVQVSVDSMKIGPSEPCARIEWNPRARQGQGAWRLSWESPFAANNSALPYALFPFQGEIPPADKKVRVTVPPSMCIRKGIFRLTLRCPSDLWHQLEPTLWAWANFGGLGGRTRRGCGALRCADFAPRDVSDLCSAMKKNVPRDRVSRDWPTLSDTLLVVNEPLNPLEAWNLAIASLRGFRQGVGFARNPPSDSNRPGRSLYPEPETIREATRAKRQISGHPRQSKIPADAFPRAELGLPIGFHFQGQGEPPETVLYPSDGVDGESRERMASPLILRPVALVDRKAVPIILRLDVPKLDGVDLRVGKKSLPLPATTVIRNSRLANYERSPLAKSPNGSALEAFLAFARSEYNFTELPQ